MEGYFMLYVDYFADDPLHNDVVFRRRFRMSRNLFLKIAEYLREGDYLRMAESKAIDCMYRFYRAIVAVFRDMYLRTHTAEDTARILEQNAERGFPGSHNDINVLQCSNVFAKLVEGTAPPVNYEINGHVYNKGFYLADGIYPRWSTFVKTISNAPAGGARSWFATQQEACRKDVERAFGVLQARFAIVWYSALT
ncbi:uncharacterized protein LOC100831876 [Brachypodium distachyon]|uniref:uncharacterized protein LOC100831876 n=1 Tax=Brachypodium distachyon TaxID=15368 RepID=UPI00052FE6EA|nr:uncharacterized protein LOC100831876 [Brachypodium distachyon]|eukprot:XP_010239009.1 uncharacterized protein LOC100831876 [Brachypodium distachyon]